MGGGESEGPGNPCERGAWGEERARDRGTLVGVGTEGVLVKVKW